MTIIIAIIAIMLPALAIILAACAAAAGHPGRRIESEMSKPDPLSQALNEGDGTYKP